MGESEGYARATPRARHPVQTLLERRIAPHVTQRIALHVFVIPVFGGSEIGAVVEADRRGQRVAERLHGSRFFELVGSVQLGRGADRETVIVQPVEAGGRIAVDDRPGNRVPLLVDLTEVPAFLIVCRRTDVDVVEQVQRRGDRNVVVDAVLHLLEHPVGEQIPFFDFYVVAERSRVGERNFLVPALLADGLLAPERIDARYAENHVRETQRNGRVLRVLRVLHVGR